MKRELSRANIILLVRLLYGETTITLRQRDRLVFALLEVLPRGQGRPNHKLRLELLVRSIDTLVAAGFSVTAACTRYAKLFNRNPKTVKVEYYGARKTRRVTKTLWEKLLL
jgi:hypothetical protein